MKSLINKLKDKRILNVLFFFTAIVYTLVLFRGILFKYVRPHELFAPYRVHYIGFNLIPFNGSGSNFIRDILINIILFAPFGFLISMKTTGRKMSFLYLLIPLSASVIFEALQYTLQLGAADITDIIMNSLGSCFGFLLYSLTLKISKNKENLHFAYSIIMFFVGVTMLILMYR